MPVTHGTTRFRPCLIIKMAGIEQPRELVGNTESQEARFAGFKCDLSLSHLRKILKCSDHADKISTAVMPGPAGSVDPAPRFAKAGDELLAFITAVTQRQLAKTSLTETARVICHHPVKDQVNHHGPRFMRKCPPLITCTDNFRGWNSS